MMLSVSEPLHRRKDTSSLLRQGELHLQDQYTIKEKVRLDQTDFSNSPIIRLCLKGDEWGSCLQVLSHAVYLLIHQLRVNNRL